MKLTGLLDSEGIEIKEGDRVSLDGNITADNSMGYLPNGWTFEEEDVYEVYFDERIQHWSLKMGVEPTTPYDVKYINHALHLLHSGKTKIV